MNTKFDIRENLNRDVESYINSGHDMIVLPPEIIKRHNTASCRHRRSTDTSIKSSIEPIKVSSWWNRMSNLHSV